MKKISDKRGLSTIVATLLIILLIMIAIGIIWVVIKKVIVEGSEQVSLGKFTLDLEIKSVVLDTGTGSVTVKVKRNPGAGEISGLKFIVDDGDTTKVIEKNGSMSELQEKTFILGTEDLGGIVVANIQKIEIAPVFTMSSGKKVAGDVKDEYVVSEGEEGGAPPPTECSTASQCNDNNPCTTDTCPSGTCVNTPITTCTNGDGCCPSGCNSVNDNDCSPVCGNNVIETGEECDDGNTASGDGCSSTCHIEQAGDWKQYLVAKWRFEPGALTADSKGTNTLTDMNSVHSSTTDKKEGAQSVVFQRFEPQEALQISNANLNSSFPLKSGGTGTFTICTWAKGSVDNGYIFSKAGDWGDSPYTVRLEIGGYDHDDGELSFGIGYNNGNNLEAVTFGTLLQANRWYHICVSHNAATKAYRMRIWDDTAGAILGTDKTGTFTNSIYVGTQPFYVSGAPSVSWGWHGPMDEFAVFNAVLTPEQMDQVRQGALSS